MKLQNFWTPFCIWNEFDLELYICRIHWLVDTPQCFREYRNVVVKRSNAGRTLPRNQYVQYIPYTLHTFKYSQLFTYESLKEPNIYYFPTFFDLLFFDKSTKFTPQPQPTHCFHWLSLQALCSALCYLVLSKFYYPYHLCTTTLL